MTESLYYGVPMVGFPFFGDQKGMCAQIHRLGLGIYSDINAAPEAIHSDLKRILEETSFT